VVLIFGWDDEMTVKIISILCFGFKSEVQRPNFNGRWQNKNAQRKKKARLFLQSFPCLVVESIMSGESVRRAAVHGQTEWIKRMFAAGANPCETGLLK
jgi:hypothetical protein